MARVGVRVSQRAQQVFRLSSQVLHWRVNVSHKAREASLTLNVVGEKMVDPQKPRLVEVSHFTFANAGFVAPGSKRLNRPASGLILTPLEGTPK
jgi:hypothetical protein